MWAGKGAQVGAHFEGDGLEFVTALQDAVLPAGVPVLPMLDLDARCIVSNNAAEPGGSWFDVFVLPDGRLAMVVGEAPGIGLTPSVTAAQTAAIIRAGLRRHGDVVAALQLADVHADDLTHSRGTTATVVLIDPDRAMATYATAGHPPPLLIPATGPARPLGNAGGGPLGTSVGRGYAAAAHMLAGGDGLLLASPAAHRLAFERQTDKGGVDWSATGFADLHKVADRLARRIAVDDTLCLVAARLRQSPHRALAIRLDDEEGRIRRTREELASWLTQLQASPMDQMALTHATLELISNAVAYGQGENREIQVEARLDPDGCVMIEVTNHGTWHVVADDQDRGRGLAMAAGLVDHLAVSTQGSGIRARLRHRLVRPVTIDVSEETGFGPRVDEVQVTHEAAQKLSLTGTVSHDEVERVAAEILLATRGGTVPVSLDLTAVTRLSSSAVRLLDDLTSGDRAVGLDTADIEILATANSVTQRALELARVPHRAG